MAIEDRRERQRAARRRLIITTARTLAEAQGWDAVTTRRLSTEIEYSQPVLYKHFTGMEQIADAIAIDGFGDLADGIRAPRPPPTRPVAPWPGLPTPISTSPATTRRFTTRCSPARPP